MGVAGQLSRLECGASNTKIAGLIPAAHYLKKLKKKNHK